MIFNTRKSDIGGFARELELLGKSFEDIGYDLRSGQGLFKSLFKKGLDTSEITLLERALEQLGNGVEPARILNTTLANTSVACREAGKSILNGTGTLSDFTKGAQKASQVFKHLGSAILNIGTVMIATAAIEGLIQLVDTLYTSMEERQEAMDNAFMSFQNAQQNTTTIRTELDEINRQIDTINAKQGLTLVEEGQLENLREARRLAEMNLAVAERQERRAAIEAGTSVFDLYKSKYAGYGAVNDKTVREARSRFDSDENYSVGMGSNDIASNVAAYLKIKEELAAQEADLADIIEFAGMKEQEIQEAIKKDLLGSRTEDSLTDDEQKSIEKQAKERAKEIVNAFNSVDKGKYSASYNWNKSQANLYDTILEDYWTDLSGMYNKIAALPQEYVDGLVGKDREIFDEIKQSADFMFKLFEPQKWESQKFDTLFDVEAISDAKDELVKYAAEQEGIGLTAKYLAEKYPELFKQIQEEVNKINQNYGTSFDPINKFIDYINSEAGVINFGELERQAKEQVKEEQLKVEVDAEIKPKFTNQEFSLWYNELSEEEKQAFHTIQLTPNFVISDHSLKELNELIQNQIKTSKPEPLDFTSFVQGSDMESLDAELSKIEMLKEAMQAVQSGEFDNAALLELTKEFPEAISNTGNMMEFLQGQIGKIIGKIDNLATEAYDAEGIIADFDQAIKDAGDNEETVAQLMALRDVILEIAYEAANMPVINIEVEKSSLDALKTALDEARSAAGLTQESVEALQNRYKGLAGFNPLELFESTNTGLYLNNGVLADLEEAYERNKFEKIGNQLAYLKEQLVYAGSGAEHDFILEQITKLELLEAQYVGLTSDYNKWTQAQSSANDRDMYEAVTGGKESVGKLIEQGWAKSDDVTSYLKLLTGKEIDDLTAQQIKELYESLDENIQGTKFSIFDFFTTDKDGNVTSDGVENFFDAVKQKLEGTELGKSVLQEDGTFNFLGDNMQDVADELGISVELMEILLRAAQEAGAKVEFNSMFTGLDEGATKVDTLKKKLDELNKTYVEIDIYTNKENIASEIDKATQEYQKALQSGDKDLQEYYGAAIDTLVARKNYKNFMGVDTSQLEGDMKKGMDLLQKWQTAKNKVEAAGKKGDEAGQTEANQEVVDLVDQINQLPEEIKTKLGFEGDEDATSFLNKIEQGTVEVDIKAILSEANKSDIQMMYEMNGKTLTANMNVEGNVKEVIDSINSIPLSKTISIDAQFSEHFAGLLTVISELNTFNPVVTIDAKSGESVDNIKSDLGTIGTGIPAVQINVNLDSASKTQTIDDINAIGSTTPSINVLVNADKTDLDELDSEVSKQRTANVVTIVYSGQLNALDQDVENVPDAEITVNVLRDKFDGLKSELETGLDTEIKVTLNPEDPLGEIKQYAGQRDSNTNPDGTPKDTGGVTNNPQNSGSSSYGLGSQVTFENPLEEVEDTEANLEVNVEGQEDVNLMIESINTLQDHQFEAKGDTQGQEELDQMKDTCKEITDVDANISATVAGTDEVKSIGDQIHALPNETKPDVTASVSGAEAVASLLDDLEKIATFNGMNISIGASASGLGGGGRNPNVSPTTSAQVTGTAHSQGNAFVNGIQGRAFKQGNWGTKNTQRALTGELGQELVVYGDRYWTVGDYGAEFTTIPRGAIVFNHKQTEELFKNGRVTSGGGRAHTFAGGTAFATGNAFAGSTIGGIEVTTDRILKGSNSKKATSSSKSSSKKSSKKSEEDKEEVFDWIEIAIDRIERAIDNLELKATSAFRTWGSRTSNLRKQMSKVTDEIKLQQKAYNRYIQEANSVGLDAHYAKLVRNGAIDIETIDDEDLIEQIQQYQEWYEKALDCAYAVDELNESLAELYQQNFDNVVAKYEGMLSIIEHEKSMLEESISQAEERGYIASVQYYEALMERERNNINKLTEQRNKIQAALSEAVASGTIAEYSEAWYEMNSQINDVTLSIEEANTAMIEYNNSIRDIEWEIFDLMQEKIGHVVEETEFLVDLLSSDKLHEDGGQLTEEGMATMGLHGMAYNTHMEQAKRYAQELKEIEQDIANDPHNQNLLERRQELLEAQRDSILAAEDERQAIVDLVQEGIDLELEALEERIDKYNESLESAKDLYEYQKRIKEQTQEIAVLEKQMMAYQGDDSEETKAKIQQIKVDLESARDELEETEYDHYIEDTEKMLDDLLTEYEELLNMRLDDVDALISDMIDRINQNSDTINDTLHSLAAEFGYEVSDIMKNTWMNDGQVVTVYDNDIMNSITNAATTLSNELQSIDDGIWQMVATFNEAAASDIENIHTNTRGYASGAYRISKNQLAWTQEGRDLEAIIRPSDGAILTPLARNDSVLNASATANLFDFANNPSQFIKDNLDIGHATDVHPHQIVGNTYDNDFSIQIALPNVSNYEQFKRELQQDKSFERMIKAMTTDRLFGGSSISKYKY